MNEYEKKIIHNIEQYGCHVTYVFDNEDDSCFTYSTGIEKCTGHPELIITGLKRELAHWIVNEYNKRVVGGERFNIDQYYEGFLEGFQVTFKEFDTKNYDDYLGSNLWLYKGPNFKTLQLIWPSTKGAWPWDDNASEDYIRLMPKLYKD